MNKLIFLILLSGCNCVAADAPFTPRDSRYRVRSGDSIHVAYRLTPEHNASAEIQPDGFATLPLIGDVKVGGLTMPEVRAAVLTKALERLNDPEITVDLKSFEQPYYIVGGEVGAPGRFQIRGRITALRAVQIAGGFKASGKASQVLLIRPINDIDGQTKLIDLKRVVDKRQLQEDVELRAGDMLIVPKTRIAKIEPVVRLMNPGALGFYLNPLSF